MIMLMVKLEVYIETCSWLGLTCDRLNKKLHNVLEWMILMAIET